MQRNEQNLLVAPRRGNRFPSSTVTAKEYPPSPLSVGDGALDVPHFVAVFRWGGFHIRPLGLRVMGDIAGAYGMLPYGANPSGEPHKSGGTKAPPYGEKGHLP